MVHFPIKLVTKINASPVMVLSGWFLGEKWQVDSKLYIKGQESRIAKTFLEKTCSTRQQSLSRQRNWETVKWAQLLLIWNRTVKPDIEVGILEPNDASQVSGERILFHKWYMTLTYCLQSIKETPPSQQTSQFWDLGWASDLCRPQAKG